MSAREDQAQQRGNDVTHVTSSPASVSAGHPNPDDIEVPRRTLAEIIARLTPDWHAEAGCRDADLSLFYPSTGKSARPALEICGRCSVRQCCLAEAMADDTLDYGVRGGLTASVRIRRRRAEIGDADAA